MTIIISNKHFQSRERETHRGKESLCSSNEIRVHTHIHKVSASPPLRRFALVAELFFSSYFFYVCIFVCTAYTNAIISFSLSLFFLFRAFVLSTSLTHILNVCMCMRVFISFFLSLSLFYSLRTHTHSDGDT